MYLKKLNVAALNVSSNKCVAPIQNNVYQLSFSKIARSGVNGNRIDMEYRFFLIFLINNLLTLLYSPTDIRQQFHTWIK